MNKLLLAILIIAISGILLGSCQMGQRQSSGSTKKTKRERIKPPVFNSDSAFLFIAKQVDFGPRVPGTEPHAECAKWLVDKLTGYGADVMVQNFKTRTYDNVTRNGKNIIASFNTENKKRILLMAHWDTRPFADHDDNPDNFNTPIDGANDGGSGVGVLLELARHFSINSPKVGIDIVFFDLEDWGPPHEMQIAYDEEYWALGSQHWSQNPHVYGYEASYGILLDMVGAKDAEFRREYHSEKEAGFVVDMVWSLASDMGYGNIFIDEPGGQITDDHYFVNKYARIPSIDIIHLDPSSKNRSFFDQWHTIDDTLENIDKHSLQVVGDVLMMLIYNEQ